MINSTYQASAMLPIVAQAIMDHFGLTLSNIMLTWTVMVVACIYLCWLFTPTQAEYYQQAKKVLGMPLPKPLENDETLRHAVTRRKSAAAASARARCLCHLSGIWLDNASDVFCPSRSLRHGLVSRAWLESSF